MDVIILDMGKDVTGESSLSDYAGKMELLSFSHGVAMQITGDLSNTERTSGKPNHQDMTVTKYLDAASPVLAQSCCQGKGFPQVDIVIGRNDSGKVIELMRYTMKNVLISSISIGGGGGDKPVETVTLNYNDIAWKFTSQKATIGQNGVVNGTWNLAKNAADS
ncbi:MAG: type VI secretion system tube protein Hcp [Acidobacteria bacterium]|nr:MAG: type VI secretion system tube protein Hcp [Acidobacteriota bacterium]